MLPKLVSAYMDSATIHGVGRVKNSKYLVLKLIWILAITGAIVIIGLQINVLYKKYQSNPVSTNIKLQSPPYMAFPNVLLCNTNPLQFSKISKPNKHPFLYEIIEVAALHMGVNMSSFTSDDGYAEPTGEPPDPDEDLMNLMSSTQDHFKMMMAFVDTQALINISQPLSEFITTCTFAGRKCTEGSLSYYRTYDYGMCVVFKPGAMLNSSVPLVASAGEKYGLHLLLHVNQIDSIPFVTSSAGVYVSVFDPAPNVSVIEGLSKGTVVPTGFESKISVSKFEEKRVGAGAGRCNPTDQPIPDCAHECIQNHLQDECGCYEYFFELNDGVINSSVELGDIVDPVTGYRPCTTYDQWLCIMTQKSFYLQKTPPGCEHCKVPCNRLEYEMGLSMVRWPAINYVPALRTIVAYSADDTTELTAENVREDYVSLNVYLASMTYKLLEEEYIYTDVNFVSDIGGQLGLWAGISVLSLMELIELGILLVAGVVCSYWATKQNRVKEFEKCDAHDLHEHDKAAELWKVGLEDQMI